MLHEGLIRLQENLITDIMEDRSLRVTNVEEGMQLIKEKLSRKRVLLVLDDVDQCNQLDIVAQTTWFGPGSRIIITTIDKHVLSSHGVGTIYVVKALDDYESLQLFSWHAFRGQPYDDYLELANYAIHHSYGHPLLLIVLGSLLRGRSRDEWEATLDSTTTRYGPEFHVVLRQSYDALDNTVKIAFLDIACFFVGKRVKYVQQILQDSGLDFLTIVQELVEKALITIQQQPLVGEVILMDDLIRNLATEIVRKESPGEPGERSRLWHHEDVHYVLTCNTGTEKIRGIMVEFPNPDEIRMLLCSKTFSNMRNLKFFISGNACLPGEFFHSGRSRNQASVNRLGQINLDENRECSKPPMNKDEALIIYEPREIALPPMQQVLHVSLPNRSPISVPEDGPGNSVTGETESLRSIYKCKTAAVEAPTPTDSSVSYFPFCFTVWAVVFICYAFVFNLF